MVFLIKIREKDAWGDISFTTPCFKPKLDETRPHLCLAKVISQIQNTESLTSYHRLIKNPHATLPKTQKSKLLVGPMRQAPWL